MHRYKGHGCQTDMWDAVTNPIQIDCYHFPHSPALLDVCLHPLRSPPSPGSCGVLWGAGDTAVPQNTVRAWPLAGDSFGHFGIALTTKNPKTPNHKKPKNQTKPKTNHHQKNHKATTHSNQAENLCTFVAKESDIRGAELRLTGISPFKSFHLSCFLKSCFYDVNLSMQLILYLPFCQLNSVSP